MPPPWLVTTDADPINDWELEYLSTRLIIGGDTIYGMQSVEGFDPPDYRRDSLENMADHGTSEFIQYSDARTITLTGDLTEEITSLETDLDALTGAFLPQSTPVGLRAKRPGWPEPRVSFCKPLRVDFPVDTMFQLGYAQWNTQLIAEDPRLYSDTLFQVDILPLTENLAAFDWTFDVSFGGGSNGQASVVNNGTFPMWPYLRINGPGNSFRLQNLTNGLTLAIDIQLSASDYLEVDFGDRTIMLNGTASRYSAKDPTSVWWPLASGTTSVQFLADGTGASTKCTFYWRYAWL